MNVGQSFLIALEMLRLHKMRAFLTMLGVIIGVMGVTIIVMISSGFQYYMSTEFKKLGADTILVMFDPSGEGGGRQSFGRTNGLRNEDVDYLMKHVSLLDVAAPIMQIPEQPVMNGDRKVDKPRIFASNENFGTLNRIGIIEGRAINADDVNVRANVALIGTEVRDTLFPGSDPIGQFITFKGITLQVIGVLEKLEIMGQTNAKDVLLPVTTAQDKWIGGKNVMMITTRPKAGVKTEDAMQAVWEALMLKSGNKKLYRVDSREALLGVLGSIIGVAGAVLAAIAALALLVGGIGIMNIMLVSVTERTREIGLRKAVGAKRPMILTQFLVEAATLSLVGGLIGMAIAWLIGSGVTAITVAKEWPSKGGLPTTFPIPAAVMATAFSALIGMVFGLFPALSASRMDPITALRHE